MCLHVCVCVLERERERERECVCLCMKRIDAKVRYFNRVLFVFVFCSVWLLSIFS